MKTGRLSTRFVLICHDSEPLNRYALARWIASFTDLAGIVVIHEANARLWKRIRREIKRVGLLRFLDVMAFRFYGRLFLAKKDRQWRERTLQELLARYPEIPASTRILTTSSPNSKETEQFLQELRPDIVIARCKSILTERIFKKASRGFFVMHPGVCPEYRNAHGCFWALANRDNGNVGMTLLRIDAGVDTGPVYGYYRCNYDEAHESHNIIQERVVFDNLVSIEARFREIVDDAASPISTAGRKSMAWGQPWLSAYWRWKKAARQNSRPS